MSAAASNATPDELSLEACDVLMAAVSIARDYQVRTVAALKLKLAASFPQTAPEVIDSALRYWARYAHETQAHLR